MTTKRSRLDQAFLDRQTRRLSGLRRRILEVRDGRRGEQAGVNAETLGQAREYEDDAQKLTTLELEENLTVVDDVRLANIERALQKLAEGTYGLSDGSGAEIPIERLEAMPEALYTIEEQNSRDTAR